MLNGQTDLFTDLSRQHGFKVTAEQVVVALEEDRYVVCSEVIRVLEWLWDISRQQAKRILETCENKAKFHASRAWFTESAHFERVAEYVRERWSLV